MQGVRFIPIILVLFSFGCLTAKRSNTKESARSETLTLIKNVRIFDGESVLEADQVLIQASKILSFQINRRIGADIIIEYRRL